MTSVLKLRDWVTLAEAAQQLSMLFDGAPFGEADVLRLALDGKLGIAVRFVNGVYARPGTLTAPSEYQYWRVPQSHRAAANFDPFAPCDIPSVKVTRGVPLTNGWRVVFSAELIYLRGIYDLPLMGFERIQLEKVWQNHVGAVATSNYMKDGAFVWREGRFFQIQSKNCDGEIITSDRVEFIQESEMHDSEKEFLRFVSESVAQGRRDNFYPSGLPEESMLVVRSSVLVEFIDEYRTAGKIERRSVASVPEYYLVEIADANPPDAQDAAQNPNLEVKDAERQLKKRTLASEAQDENIINEIRRLGYEPLQMPSAPSGNKPWPLREKIRQELRLSTEQMKHAWKRLRAAKRIKDS